MNAGMLAALAGCSGSSTSSVPPAATPSCESGAVIYDTGGTNGYGRLLVVSNGQVTAPTDLAFMPGKGAAFVVTEQDAAVSSQRGCFGQPSTCAMRPAVESES
jgi:hypothetical protein